MTDFVLMSFLCVSRVSVAAKTSIWGGDLVQIFTVDVILGLEDDF